ncbi:MAG: HD domain-containing protein [Bacteroidales bacterium]|nr:HD domain-containing protein [Bacteroidales bacterium]
MTTIHQPLREYLETEILPRYSNFDPAHQIGHAREVISQSLQLAAHYEVDMNMVYTIAAYHDTGLCEGREMHHKSSGRILREDKVLREFLLPDNSPLFTPEQIEVMAQAVEDHRASSSTEPRSIYGKIVAEADRIIDGPTIVRRTIQYGLSNYPHLNKEGHYQRFLEHMAEKYACGGYLKLWIPESPNACRLAAFQDILEDPVATRSMFEEEWKKLIAR